MQGKLRNMTSIYIENKERGEILLLYRIGSRIVNNKYIGSAGGHFENDELNDAKKCVLRELNEELGLTEDDITNLKLRYITLRHKKGEIRQNYYFFAQLIDNNISLQSNEGELHWFKYDEILSLDNMPHTAKYVVQHYIKTGKNTDKLYGGIAIPNGMEFSELNEF